MNGTEYLYQYINNTWGKNSDNLSLVIPNSTLMENYLIICLSILNKSIILINLN